MEKLSSGQIRYSLPPTRHDQCTAVPFPKKNQRGTLSLIVLREGPVGGGGGGRCTQANKTSNQISISPILSNQHIDRAEKGLLESLLRQGVGNRKTSFLYRSKIA